MKILTSPSACIEFCSPEMDFARITLGARTCYKSALNKGRDKDEELLDNLWNVVKPRHTSVFEHSSATAHIICDRGVSHELVRHRLASYSQESTRYCNYSNSRFGNEITVIKPFYIPDEGEVFEIWKQSCETAEKAYFELLNQGGITEGISAETARSVLPTCLKTEIIMTANLVEWYHILDVRTSRKAHPDMRLTMYPILFDMHLKYPTEFDDLFFDRTPQIVEDFANKN